MRSRPVLIGAVAAALLMLPAAVSAHAYELRLDCDGLHVELLEYKSPPDGEENTITVFVDGEQRYHETFDVNHVETYSIGSPYESHNVRVEVRAWDDTNGPDEIDGSGRSFSFNWEDSIGACAEPTPAPTPDATEKPDRTPRPDRTPKPDRTHRPTTPPAPTVKPNLDLPPTDTAGDFGASGGQGGDQSGLLLGMAILASAGAAFVVLSLRRGASSKL